MTESSPGLTSAIFGGAPLRPACHSLTDCHVCSFSCNRLATGSPQVASDSRNAATRCDFFGMFKTVAGLLAPYAQHDCTSFVSLAIKLPQAAQELRCSQCVVREVCDCLLLDAVPFSTHCASGGLLTNALQTQCKRTTNVAPQVHTQCNP